MCIRNTLSAVAGTAVVFIWTSISWMFLTWHNIDMKSFKNDGQTITESIKAEAPESGLYVIPNVGPDHHSSTEAQEAWATKAKAGPLVFMSVKSDGLQWDMTMALVIQFVIQLIVALGAVALLAQTTLTNVFKKALFVCVAVTLGTFLVEVSHWTWWGFPLVATLVYIVDTAIGWLLGGLVIGAIARTRASR